MIGEPLKAHLMDRGHTLHTLVRREPRNPSEHRWYPEKGVIESGIIDHVDAVVNLSGASIGKLPWTRKHKDLILSSRVQATDTIAQAIAASATPPAVLIQGSAVGLYGDRAEEDLTEHSPAGEGFLADVVLAWEGAAAPAASPQTRVVFARTGLVVGRGGAMAPLMLQTSLGVAGPVGSGTQWWPWVSLLDEVRALAYLIENPQAEGPYNLVGPTPARANDLARALAKKMKRPFWLGLPAFIIKTVMGEGGVSLLLTSQHIRSQKLETEGFRFEDTTVDDALARIVGS
ncbi:MAG: hypothetical protein ACJAV4_000813 [Pontimonas sp.]|jgi:uncharacterized protein (TIGR01777 family)